MDKGIKLSNLKDGQKIMLIVGNENNLVATVVEGIRNNKIIVFIEGNAYAANIEDVHSLIED